MEEQAGSGQAWRSPVHRVLVGVDRSEVARHALMWAGALARPLGAEVVAVHVVGLLERLQTTSAGSGTDGHDELAEALATWCAPLDQFGIRWRSRLLEGSPVPVLLAAVDEEGAELVVVGSRGGGGFPELRLGSTSHQLAEHAHRPVLIVAPDAPLPEPVGAGSAEVAAGW
jgi:nucleotide-binding universal stress UspA family protein